MKCADKNYQTYKVTHVGEEVGASVLAAGEPVGLLLRRRRKKM